MFTALQNRYTVGKSLIAKFTLVGTQARRSFQEKA